MDILWILQPQAFIMLHTISPWILFVEYYKSIDTVVQKSYWNKYFIWLSIPEASADFGHFSYKSSSLALPAEPRPISSPALAETPQEHGLYSHKSPGGRDVHIHVMVCDITTMDVDAIMNPSSELLSNSFGLAKIISKAAGPRFQAKCDDYIRKYRFVKETENCVTSGGNLPCKYVIHTVPPLYSHSCSISKEQFLALLENTYTNIMKTASENNFGSLALPMIGKYITSKI